MRRHPRIEELVLIVIGSMLLGVGIVWRPLRRTAWQDGWDAGFGVGYHAGCGDERKIMQGRSTRAYSKGFLRGYVARYGHFSEKIRN
jgi:hypothetical protein